MNKICKKPGRKKTHLVKGLKGAKLAAEGKDNEKTHLNYFLKTAIFDSLLLYSDKD